MHFSKYDIPQYIEKGSILKLFLAKGVILKSITRSLEFEPAIFFTMPERFHRCFEVFFS